MTDVHKRPTPEPQAQTTDELEYEAPAIVALGKLDEFTFGGGPMPTGRGIASYL